MIQFRIDSPRALVGAELSVTALLLALVFVFSRYARIGPSSNGWGTALFFAFVAWWFLMLALTLIFVHASRQDQDQTFAYALGWSLVGAILTYVIFGSFFPSGYHYSWAPAAVFSIYSVVLSIVPASAPWLRIALGYILVPGLTIWAWVYVALMLFCC